MKSPTRKVLIIDDSPDDRAEMRRLLLAGSETRYRFIEAELGTVGLRLCRDAEDGLPDIVLLDFNLPDMNAADLLAELCNGADLPPCPVVVLTGSDQQSGPELLRAGAQDFLGKSWTTAESLTHALESSIDRFALLVERARTTEQLREREHFLQRMTNVTPGVMHVFDLAQQRSIFLNRSVAAVIGYTPAEIAAMGNSVVATLMHPDDLARFPAHIERLRALRDDEIADFEHRMRGRAGEWHWFYSRDAVFARDAAGAVTQIIGAANEITAQKQAEATRARLSAVVESSDDAIIATDLSGIIVSWNRAAVQLFGYTEAEIVGRSATLLIPPDRQDEETSILQRIAEGSGTRFETMRRRKDGTQVALSLTVSPVMDEHGKIVGASKISRDITERKMSERALGEHETRMRLATEATDVGVWEWNVLTNVIRWDAQMFRLHGIVPTVNGFVTYSDWSEAVLPEDFPEWERILQATARRGGQSRREYRLVRRNDGELRHVETIETVRTNADGIVEWVVGTNLDVTERKAAEIQLRQVAAELSEAGRLKDEFLATLAHELRNPLAPIRTGLQLMKREGNQAAAFEETRNMMERQVTQMVRLVDDLMDASRISRGKIDLRMERVSLAQVLNDAVETSDPMIKQMGHELTVTLPSQPIIVDADRIRLAQVFSNLLNNAAKYSDRGGHIHLHVEPQGNDVLVRVKDTGVGIAVGELPRVFDLFTQVDRSLDKSLGGLGIGLSLVKRVVEMHGGQVEAKSDGPGRGSEFSVRLPVSVEALPTQDSSDLEGQPNASPRRVLIVDDNRDAADVLAMLLELSGNETRTAYDGQQAVDLAGLFQPEVLLVDIGLPKLNGHEVCRRIREQGWGKNVVLIAVTGWGQDEDRQRTKDAGFDHHMVKPVDPQEIMKILASMAAPAAC